MKLRTYLIFAQYHSAKLVQVRVSNYSQFWKIFDIIKSDVEVLNLSVIELELIVSCIFDSFSIRSIDIRSI